MTAVWLTFRSELRSRWRSWIALSVLVGVVAGAVIATASGARRTETALERHVSAFRLHDVFVGRGFWVDGRETLDLSRIEQVPQVAVADRWASLAVLYRNRSGEPVLPDGTDAVGVGVWLDKRGGAALDRPKLLQGRTPDADRADEAIVDSTAFDRLGYALGETIALRLISHRVLWKTSAADHLQADPATTRWGPLVHVRIVGVAAATSTSGAPGWMTLTPAFYRAHGGRKLGVFIEGVGLRLKRGAADLPSFERALRLVAGDHPFATPNAERAKIQEPIRLQARALSLAAALAAAALVLFLAQALVRLIAVEAASHSTLRALGMTRRQLMALGTARAALIGTAASLFAVAVAVTLSLLMPLGRARDLEPSPGIDLDSARVGAGAMVLIVSATLIGAVASWRATRRSAPTQSTPLHSRGRRGSAADALARLGCPPAVVSGVRFAFARGRGTASVPVATTLAGAVLAVAVVAAAVTFSQSLRHLIGTPRLYGANFDYIFWSEGQTGELPLDRRLLGDPALAGVAWGTPAELSINGERVVALAHDTIDGDVPPTVLEGRAPRMPDEILLGPKTLDALDLEIGDVATVSAGKGSARMRIVGRGLVVPPLWEEDPFGRAAAVTFQALKRLDPGAVRSEYRIRIAPGADREAVLSRLERTYGQPRFGTPADITNFRGISALPVAVSVLFGALGATMLAHCLVTSVRRRRRDLAILKTLGFDRHQILATLAWQSMAIASVGLLAGLPLGIAIGRFGWNLFATDLGVVSEPATPLPLALMMIPAVLLVANGVAVLPARLAAGTRPAVVLRAE